MNTNIGRNLERNIPANTGALQDYKKDFYVAALFIAVAAATFIFSFLSDEHRITLLFVSFVSICVGLRLVTMIFLTKKIVALILSGKADTVQKIMEITKKRNKEILLNHLENAVLNGHLIGYRVENGNEIIKEMPMADDSNQ